MTSFLEQVCYNGAVTVEVQGKEIFRAYYGDNTVSTENLLYGIYPDIGTLLIVSRRMRWTQMQGWFILFAAYGWGCGANIISSVETSCITVASLIATDTPLQARWHIDNARRNGASLEEVKAVRRWWPVRWECTGELEYQKLSEARLGYKLSVACHYSYTVTTSFSYATCSILNNTFFP
jgi:hypothetical protein